MDITEDEAQRSIAIGLMAAVLARNGGTLILSREEIESAWPRGWKYEMVGEEAILVEFGEGE